MKMETQHVMGPGGVQEEEDGRGLSSMEMKVTSSRGKESFLDTCAC